MTHAHRRPMSAVGALLVAALVVAACGTVTGSATPAGSPSVTPTASTAPTAAATTAATTAPVATATASPARTPTPTPTASPSAAACVLRPQTGVVPSDRLTAIQVLGAPGRDVVRFEFGSGSLTPAGPPTGSLDVASPPFTEGASGLPIDLAGEHALKVVFRGMSIMNDVGQPTFTGEREIRGTDASRSLRHVAIFDESEGQIGFYLGYDGPSCITLNRDGDTVVLAIDFGPGS